MPAMGNSSLCCIFSSAGFVPRDDDWVPVIRDGGDLETRVSEDSDGRGRGREEGVPYSSLSLESMAHEYSNLSVKGSQV